MGVCVGVVKLSRVGVLNSAFVAEGKTGLHGE